MRAAVEHVAFTDPVCLRCSYDNVVYTVAVYISTTTNTVPELFVTAYDDPCAIAPADITEYCGIGVTKDDIDIVVPGPNNDIPVPIVIEISRG
jgi:hypothetical protein